MRHQLRTACKQPRYVSAIIKSILSDTASAPFSAPHPLANVPRLLAALFRLQYQLSGVKCRSSVTSTPQNTKMEHAAHMTIIAFCPCEPTGSFELTELEMRVWQHFESAARNSPPLTRTHSCLLTHTHILSDCAP